MTGEMYESDLTPDEYPLHFAVARALKGKVRPFDVYQGPYVVIGEDITSGAQPYAYCPRGLGVVRLWIIDDDGGGTCTVYNEANDKISKPFWWNSTRAACRAARSVL